MVISLPTVAKSNQVGVTFSNIVIITEVTFGLIHDNKNIIGSVKIFENTHSNISRTTNTCSSINNLDTNKRHTLDLGGGPEYYRKEKGKRV